MAATNEIPNLNKFPIQNEMICLWKSARRQLADAGPVVLEEEALKREQLPLGTRRLLMEAVTARGQPSPTRAARAPGARAGRASASPNASPEVRASGPAAARDRGISLLQRSGVDLSSDEEELRRGGVPIGLRVHLSPRGARAAAEGVEGTGGRAAAPLFSAPLFSPG
ncbi:hypothetical protein T484DRAFT_1892770, partial [Baffinella frigidus]